MKEEVIIIKVGGKIVEEEASLDSLLNKFCSLSGKKILVHGGGRTATALAKRMGVETKMVDGRRVTDREMLDIVTMVYGGLVNKKVVAALDARGLKALGMTGADLNLMTAHKRPVKDVDYGFVGDVDKTDGEALAFLLERNIVPVVAPLTHNGQGTMLNTNADTIAAEVAKSLANIYDVTLMFCFEKNGVMAHPDIEDSVIPSITPASFKTLKERGIVKDGMIPKIDNSIDALNAGVKKVVITCAEQIGKELGTTITL